MEALVEKEVSAEVEKIIKQVLELLNSVKDQLPPQAKAALGILAAVIGYGKPKEAEASEAAEPDTDLANISSETVQQSIENSIELLNKAMPQLPEEVVKMIKELLAKLSALLGYYGYPKYGYYGYPAKYGYPEKYGYYGYPEKHYGYPEKPAEKGSKTKEGNSFSESAVLIEAAGGEEQPLGLVWRISLIQAGMSKNGRYYPPEVLRAAVPLADGLKVFADHPANGSPQRSVKDIVGWISDPAFDPNCGPEGALVGIFHALESSPISDTLLEAYQRGKTDLLEFSIFGKGSQRPDRVNGKICYVVEAIHELYSVDVVPFGAAGGRIQQLINSVSEAEEELEMIEQLTVDDLKRLRPDLVESLSGQPAQPAIDELRKEIAKLQEQLAVEQTKRKLSELLREANLPAPVAERVMSEFAGRAASEEELRAAVERERQFYAKLVEEFKPQQPRVQVQIVEDQGDRFVKALEATIRGKPVDGVAGFRGLHQAYCWLRGINLADADPHAIATAMLRESVGFDSERTLMESISWSTAFGTALYRILLDDYRMPAFDEWRLVVGDNIVNLKDLREQTRVRVGYYGVLPSVSKGSTYQPLTSPGEETITYSPAKYGGLEDWTWEDALADDLNALRRIPRRLALAAKYTLHQFVFSFLSENPTIYDGIALFHNNHSNLGSNALSSAALTAAKVAMRSQAAAGGVTIGLTPKYMVIPPELEATALKLRNSDVDWTADENATTANPHKGTFDIIVVDYWTDDNNWYLVADPNLAPSIELGFLNGKQEPELFVEASESGSAFTADKVVIKVRFVFGGAVVDYRPLYGAIVS